jgi:hypothetical protein
MSGSRSQLPENSIGRGNFRKIRSVGVKCDRPGCLSNLPYLIHDV